MKNYHSSLKRKNQDVITVRLRAIFIFKNKKGQFGNSGAYLVL